MKILYTRPDSGVTVIHAASIEKVGMCLKGANGELTQQEYEAHVWERSVPKDAINAVRIDDDFVFPDLEFRDAWSQDGANINHDMTKVKQIQLERVRRERDALLAKYDGLQSRANDLGDTDALADLKIKKQQLRDATDKLKSVEAATIEEVKAVTPDLSGY